MAVNGAPDELKDLPPEILADMERAAARVAADSGQRRGAKPVDDERPPEPARPVNGEPVVEDEATLAREAERDPAFKIEPVADKAKEKTPEEIEKEQIAKEQEDAKSDADKAGRYEILSKAESRIMEKLAAKEAQIAAREQALLAREGQVPSEVQEWQQAKERAKADPIGFLRSLGLTDTAAIAEAAIAESLPPEQVPPALKARIEARQTRSQMDPVLAKLEAIEKRLNEREQKEEMGQKYALFTASAGQAIKSGTPEKYPVIHSYLADERSDEVMTGLVQYMETIRSKAGFVPALDSLIEMYENDLQASLPKAAIAALRKEKPKTQSIPAGTTQTAPSGTLNHKSAPGPITQPPPKPKDDSELRKQAAHWMEEWRRTGVMPDFFKDAD